MKRIMAILLALVLALAICVPAMAEATLTIKNAKTGTTYAAYQMLDLEVGNGSYKYSITGAWKEFFTSGKGADYLVGTKPAGDVVPVMVDGVLKYLTITEGNVSEFATYARGAAGTATATTSAANGEAEFNEIGDGYYLVVVLNSDGTISTASNPIVISVFEKATIAEKNAYPTFKKEVQDGNEWVDKNTASFGDTVTFKATMQVSAAGKEYTLHDTMGDGLTFDKIVSVTIGGKSVEAGTDYNMTIPTDGCTFEIAFDDPDNGWNEGTEIVVIYTAVLNKNAVNENGGVNTAKLTYENKYTGADGTPKNDTTETVTYEFDLVKTNSKDELIGGAKFKLYDAPTGEEGEIKLSSDGKGYYPNPDAATGAEIDVTGGKVVIYGLGNGTYYLEETVAPAGFNKLTSRVEVKIENDNLRAKFGEGDAANTWVEGGAQVMNLTGSELPSTGGIGTTIFYVVGGLMMAAAVVLLVTKKKTSGNK